MIVLVLSMIVSVFELSVYHRTTTQIANAIATNEYASMNA
jgi:hypothetical protein